MKNIKVVLSIAVLILLSLLMIVPTVSAESINASRGMVANHYPARFDRVGTINIVDKSGVVVDDMYVSFSSQVQFMTPSDKYSTLESFRPGQRVGYTLNKEKQITKFCLILEAEEGSS